MRPAAAAPYHTKKYSLFLVVILGDIADERFMKKANTSDITQFTLIFPSTSTSCMCSTVSLAFAYCSLFNPLVWIIFWFTLSAGSLVGFSFLGQTLWKVGFLCFFFFAFQSPILPRQLNSEQMYAQAGVFPVLSVFLDRYTHICILLQLDSSRLENAQGFTRPFYVTPLVLYSSSPS